MSSIKMSHKHIKMDEKTITEQLKEQIKNLKKFPTEKTIRCQAFQADKSAMVNFVASTKKEQLLLECVKRYETHFREQYDGRSLLLYPQNEAGVPKFICSFIRPTQVSYIELFDYIDCVRFISNFMMYEELEEPRRYPEVIVSPYNSIKWQIGDSADIAILTASLLIGVGFDVFVVVGEANHEITKKNENNVTCFFLTKDDFELKDSTEEKDGEPDEALPPNDTRRPSQHIGGPSILPALEPEPSTPTADRRDSGKLAGTASSKVNAAAQPTGERVANTGQFFNFDLTRQQETYQENRIFDQYNQVKNSEENPYYKNVVKNETRNFDAIIFKAPQSNRFSRRANQTVGGNRCEEDIFHKDPNKHLFKTNYESQFKKFLRDDEPQRLKVVRDKTLEAEKPAPVPAKPKDLLQSQNIIPNSTAFGEKASPLASTHQPLAPVATSNNPDMGLHFWLLIRASGMRDIKKSVFMDPISGRFWDTDNKVLPFYSVKQIFNNRNCWIHLNETTHIGDINFDTFDNYQNEEFEFVLNEEVAKLEKKVAPQEEEETPALEAPSENMTRRLSARKSIFMQTAENSLGDTSAKLKATLAGMQVPLTSGKDAPGIAATKPGASVASRFLGNPFQNQNQNPNMIINMPPQKTFAEKIINMEELFQRPSTWVPKFDISRERFLAKFAKNRQRKFYQKCQVDYFSRLTQSDGLVKRVQIFMDHNRLLMKEVRSYYSDRSDKLRVKREFPFEFKTIEFYDSFGSSSQNSPQSIVPHWREIETQIGRKIIFKFYPLRFHDGLIEREEIIGEKTIERFSNRDDRLVYCSVRFQKICLGSTGKETYNYEDRHVGAVQILKMVQKFEKNPRIEGSKQIAKVIIDLERNNIKLIYHLGPQQISPLIIDTNRECFTGIISRADKKAAGGPAGQSKVQFLYSLEKECFSKIKVSENLMINDIKNFKNAVEDVGPKADKAPAEDKFQSVSNMYSDSNQLLLPVAAIDKTKDEELDLVPEDRVEMELKNRGLLGQKIDQTMAEEIKREILTEVEDRFIQRADIINKRFEEEKAKVKGMHKKIQKKTFEAASTPEEDRTFEEELYHFNLKIAILEQRLFNFQKVAFEKYAEIQNQLNSDPRLNNLS